MSTVAIDTNIFIYHLESHKKFGPLAQRLFAMVEEGDIRAVASMITFSEILTLPAGMDDDPLFKKYDLLLQNFPNLDFIPVDFAIASLGAKIRSQRKNLKLMDAFILATAQTSGADVLITEDARLGIPKFPVVVQTLGHYLRGYL